MTQPSASEVVCASCGNHASGRFCSACGASLEPLACAGCGEMLSPGARFCHSCGRAHAPVPNDIPISTRGRPGPASSLPWIVAAIALITLLAFLAGSAFNRRRGSTLDAPQIAMLEHRAGALCEIQQHGPEPPTARQSRLLRGGWCVWWRWGRRHGECRSYERRYKTLRR